MVILKTQSEFGHAPPPQTPYSVISNLPGWDVAQAVRDGDHGPLKRVVHIYPRFAPTHSSAMVRDKYRILMYIYIASSLANRVCVCAKQLGQEIAKCVGQEGKAALVYLNPAVWPYTLRHITLESRGRCRMKAEDVSLRCVDVAGHRVYAVLVEPQHMPTMTLTWQNPGLGISIRGAEGLLRGVDGIKEVSIDDDALPAPTWTPEGPAHQGIRERIVQLLRRAPLDADKVRCTARDVFLYPTGMAAIFHSSNLLLEHRPGTIVVLGVVFHNTYHHLVEECPHGWKHFGRADEGGLSEMEEWLLGGEEKAVSYVFVEVPGNPTLDTPDMYRLKKMVKIPPPPFLEHLSCDKD